MDQNHGSSQNRYNSKKKKSCMQFFSNFDYFGQQIQFQVNKKEKYTTMFGGISFMLFMVVSLAYICYNFYHFVSRNIFTLTYATKTDPQAYLQVGKYSFLFNIGFYYPGYEFALDFVDEYLNITMTLVNNNYSNPNNPDILKTTEYSLKFCDYNDVKSAISKEIYDIWQFNKVYCPDVNLQSLDFTILGNLGTEIYNYLDITISIKKEKLGEIDKILQRLSNKPIFAEITAFNQQVNFDNYNDMMNPTTYVFDQYLDLETLKTSEIYYSALNFTTDNNILWPNPIQQSDIIVNSVRDYFYFIPDRTNQINPDARVLSRFSIRQSENTVIYERSYQKLTDFIANMTGLLSQAILILYVIVGYVNQKSSQQKIINKTMKFKGHKNFDLELLVQLIKQENTALKNKEISSNCSQSMSKTLNNEKSFIKYPNNSQHKNLVDSPHLTPLNIEHYQVKNSKQRSNSKHSFYKKLNACEILFACCKKKTKVSLEVINKGEERINHYLDVLTYIQKMREIEILKYILLNTDQLNFFNFISRPSVDFTAEIEDHMQVLGSDKFNYDMIEKIKLSYQKMKNRDDLTYADKILLRLFGIELSIFV